MTQSQTFDTFGAILKFLRRRARLTQMELGIAVGYNEAHISRLENGQRQPDLAAVAALFVPALDLQDEPGLAARLLELAGRARDKTAPRVEATQTTTTERFDIVGAIESIPPLPPYFVPPEILDKLGEQLVYQRGIVLCGMAGAGKTTLAAALAHERAKTQPVFWLTFTAGVTTSAEIVIRQLALFALEQGHEHVVTILAPRQAGKPALALDQQLALIAHAFGDREVLLCFDRANLVRDDEAILRVFTHLLATSRPRLLLTSREELPLPGMAQVRLNGMAGAEASRLLSGLDAGLEPGLAAQLIAKTGGNPMLLRLAVGQVHLGRDAATLVAHLETEPEVTAFIVDAVLKSLSPSARRLAELLSVFRQPVDLQDETLIERAHQIGSLRLKLGKAIVELQQRQLIDHPAMAMLHPLVRDHIYNSLGANLSQRRALDDLAGQWLADDPHQFLQAAFHLGRASSLKRAVDLLTDQAPALIETGQAETGVQVIDELIARVRRRKGAADLLRSLLTVRGDLLVTTPRIGEADENYQEALRLTRQPAVRAHIALRLAGSLTERNRATEALRLCETISPGISEHSHLLLSAQLAATVAQARLTLSDLDASQHEARRALELVERLRPAMPREASSVEAQARLGLGILYNLRGQAREATFEWKRALAAARASNLRTIEYRSQMNLGIVCYQQGDWANALENYQAALLGARSSNDSIMAARIWSNIAIVRHICGELDEALAAAEQARVLKEQLGDRIGVANADNTRASILLALEKYDQACTICESAIAEAEAGNAERLLGGYLDTLAQIRLAQGKAPEAMASLQRILELQGACTDVSLMLEVHCHLVLALLASGQVEAAQVEWKSLGKSSDPRHEIEQDLAGGWLARARGDLPAAEEYLRQARRRVKTSGYALYARGLKRLESAIRNPSRPADLRF